MILEMRSSHPLYKYNIMLQNHLKVALRQLRKNKFITGVNLLGLVLGMTAALFIWQYVDYERSYDKFHSNADQIYRIRTDRIQDGEPFMQFAAGAAFAGKILNTFPEVENYVKLKTDGDAVYVTPSNQEGMKLEDVVFAMPSVFEVFDFPLQTGDKATCLNEPFKACISESVAKRLFGSQNPIGKTIRRNDQDNHQYEVTGVFADFPSNSHIKLDVMLSYITFSDVFMAESDDPTASETAPYWDGYFTYVQLQEGTDWKAIEAAIPTAIRREYDEEVASDVELYLQPLTDIHLTSNYLFEAEINGDGKAVYFLSLVGIIVLFIAWLNYINLAVARSVQRAKEVGIRKVAGSGRMGLMTQFLTETALVNVVALGIALFAFWGLQPLFEQLVGKAVPPTLVTQAKFGVVILATLVGGTFLSGWYPAFLLSGFKPMDALKNGLSKSGKGQSGWLQQGLVVVQFTASVALIAATIIIYQQLSFLQNKKLGVNIDQTLVLNGPNIGDSTFVEKSKVLQSEIKKLAEVREVSYSTSVPGQAFGWTAGGIERVDSDVETPEGFHVMAASLNYSEMYELALLTGNHMSPDRQSDHDACLINATAAKLLKFDQPEEAVGQDITFWGDQYTISGVLEDFHQESPKAIIEPLILVPIPDDWMPSYYSIKVGTDQLTSTIASISSIWQDVLPGNPFDYFFLDEHFAAQYAADQRFGRLFTLFSVLAIIVSCLGLFALVAFIAERRRKEIGIRKVLGASVPGLVAMLSKDFMRLVFIALVIATPIAWYLMNNWLNNFAERMDIKWWTFALAGIIAIGIAMLTMSYQSLKAALANPVNALRSE